MLYDKDNNLFFSQDNLNEITKIENIPLHTQNAFISIEDKRFYSHNGVDYKGLIRATFNNIKSFSFKEGASTITQQLIKNTLRGCRSEMQNRISFCR
jgi:penicillin-binding protein 1A